MKTKLLILFLLVAALHVPARAQQVAVKSNLLTDIALCPAVGVEAGLAKKVTLENAGSRIDVLSSSSFPKNNLTKGS